MIKIEDDIFKLSINIRKHSRRCLLKNSRIDFDEFTILCILCNNMRIYLGSLNCETVNYFNNDNEDNEDT